MVSFDEGSNFTTIIDENDRAITLSCFENGEGYIQYEEARFRAGVGAELEELEKFFENCLKMINKFRE